MIARNLRNAKQTGSVATAGTKVNASGPDVKGISDAKAKGNDAMAIDLAKVMRDAMAIDLVKVKLVEKATDLVKVMLVVRRSVRKRTMKSCSTR